MDQKETALLESIAVECAQIFQRSSSCVEGRNGHLSLYHHSLHRLSDRKLEALTAVHEFGGHLTYLNSGDTLLN
ncbi:DUF6399 domain-containing protein [uncultured Desulfobacter sp.]|uniref:DUF6399 domain-containing protein n=1 Tax=uncultured Desulfobacter sp. TaxID=240139 RepID=UPI0033902E5D